MEYLTPNFNFFFSSLACSFILSTTYHFNPLNCWNSRNWVHITKFQIWTCSVYIIYQERLIITEVKGARTEIAVQIYRPRCSRVFPALPLVQSPQSWSAIGRLPTQLSGCGNYKCFDSSHRVNVNVKCIQHPSLNVNISTHKQATPWPGHIWKQMVKKVRLKKRLWLQYNPNIIN